MYQKWWKPRPKEKMRSDRKLERIKGKLWNPIEGNDEADGNFRCHTALHPIYIFFWWDSLFMFQWFEGWNTHSTVNSGCIFFDQTVIMNLVHPRYLLLRTEYIFWSNAYQIQLTKCITVTFYVVSLYVPFWI